MTKRDYIRVADALAVAADVCTYSTDQAVVIAYQTGKREALRAAAVRFAILAKAENPQFDEAKFFLAAKVQP